ncbi:MAG: sensor histidine kinase [Saprospiraceae bacterium]|nr:sensor histidine kinase [Saprospiraceae bacterium]
MKKYFLLVCCAAAWLCPLALAAQAGQTDKALVDSLNDLSFESAGEPARQFALAAQKLADSLGYRKGVADSYLRLGRVAAQSGNWAQSELFYQHALTERKKLNNPPDIASCYNQLGNLHKAQGDYAGAAACFRQGLAILENEPPHLNTITLNSNLGHVLRLLGKYEQARQCLETACRMHDALDTGGANPSVAVSRASVRMNLAEFLQSALHQYDDAADSLRLSLDAFNALGKKALAGKCLLLLGNNAYFRGAYNDAQAWYEQGIALAGELNEDDLFILYRNRGRVRLDQGLYEQALNDFRICLAAFEAQQDSQQMAAAQFEIGNYHYERNKTDSAVHYYRLALDNNIQDPILKGRVLYFLSDALFGSGQIAPSKQYVGEFTHLLEDLQAEQTSGAFADLIWHFWDKNRLQRQITRQEKQTQKTYGLILIGVLALLALLGWLVARLQSQKRKLAERQAEIARQQEKIAQQEKLDSLKAREAEIGYARLEAQDERQREIGRELHDNLGGTLTTIRLYLGDVDEVQDAMPPSVREQYRKATRLLARACEDLRNIAHDFNATSQMTFGLEHQLKTWAAEIPLQVELSTHGLEERLDLKTEINTFRIVQELVHNVVKHAKARNVSIAVSRFPERISVLVEDDGQGFDVVTTRIKPGLGLQSLASRVQEMNGELQIDSRPGHGATISVDIPVKQT